MPGPDRSDYLSPPLPRHAPSCPNCGARMRLVRVQPDRNYSNLDRRLYICECGENATNLEAYGD
jgi:hypothetical protein